MAYGTLEEANTYHQSSFTDPLWTSFSNERRTAALESASFYIDWVYGRKFNGTPATDDREWPRVGSVDSYGRSIGKDSIPNQVKFATYIAALYALQNPDTLFRAADPAEHIQSQHIGSIKKSFFKSKFGKPVILLEIESLLSRLIKRQTHGLRIVV